MAVDLEKDYYISGMSTVGKNRMTKICSKCGIEKDLKEFSKNCSGVRAMCKLCRSSKGKEYYRKNAERIKARCKKYCESHKAKISTLGKKYYQENAERIKIRGEKYRKNHKVEIKILTKKYYQENVEKIKTRGKEYRRTHKEKRNIRQKQRRRIDPMFKLNDNITSYIGKSLKGNKKGRHWETLVGWTLQQFKNRFVQLFEPGMTWENKGEWHIDHKIPVCVFNFEKPGDVDFKRCFALKNLQLLPALDNIIKSNKLEKHFQPSLIFGQNR